MRHHLALLCGASAALAAAVERVHRMNNLVTFGDSYTDENRLGYFINHHGQPPPPGTLLPSNSRTSSGGFEWGRIAAKQAGSDYYNYAVSGAVCSNDIITRQNAALHAPYPDVLGYEVKAFAQDVDFHDLFPDRYGSNTVYALWIGTNDLGNDAFLTDSQLHNTDISDYIECVWKVFDAVYKTGGRQFVLLNTAPLHLAPLYTPPESSGAGNNQFWADKLDYNATEYQYKMLEYTTTVNTVFDAGVPYQLLVESRWPGATVSVFDVHSLMLDIRANPDQYLDAPANVTGYYHHCEKPPGCVDSKEPKASFMWYDALHPSERVHEYIASNFIDVVNEKSKYGKTYRRQ